MATWLAPRGGSELAIGTRAVTAVGRHVVEIQIIEELWRVAALARQREGTGAAGEAEARVPLEAVLSLGSPSAKITLNSRGWRVAPGGKAHLASVE